MKNNQIVLAAVRSLVYAGIFLFIFYATGKKKEVTTAPYLIIAFIIFLMSFLFRLYVIRKKNKDENNEH